MPDSSTDLRTMVREYYAGTRDGSILLDELYEQGFINSTERQNATITRIYKRVVVRWGNPREQFLFYIP